MNSPTLPDYIKPGAVVRVKENDYKFRIYATDGVDGTVHGAYFVRGAWHVAGISPDRIISAWTDKPDCSKLWPLLPPWIKWIAQDEDGDWRGHMTKPIAGSIAWDTNHDNSASWKWYITIPQEYHPIFEGDWKDSLVERPTQ